MNQNNVLPHDIDMEKNLLSALLIRDGEIIPEVSAIVSADDFYRPEHKIIFRVILQLSEQGIPPNMLSIAEKLRKTDELKKIGFTYLFSISALAFTNSYAVTHAKTIKEKSNRRKLVEATQSIMENAQTAGYPTADIIAEAQRTLDMIQCSATPSQKMTIANFFANKFNREVVSTKFYNNRSVGFKNLDEQQFFLPGLYVIGATPAAGKTTFCYQLLEQLARKGESVIYCSYEMSQIELFSKTLARELFKSNSNTKLTAAQIRKGGTSVELERLIADLTTSPMDLNVLELQDETVDDLLGLLKPLCHDKTKAPVVCLDYLQIMPTTRESTKLGIDETVRKLKKFQRDTNTTFIVISSFNRTNYAQPVSFESFKDSGNIEYTADVVWALQLNVINDLKSGLLVSEARKKIDEAKKQQPRQIQLKCLKNRQGANYDCCFYYHAAHDYFEPCESFNKIDPPPSHINKEDTSE